MSQAGRGRKRLVTSSSLAGEKQTSGVATSARGKSSVDEILTVSESPVDPRSRTGYKRREWRTLAKYERLASRRRGGRSCSSADRRSLAAICSRSATLATGRPDNSTITSPVCTPARSPGESLAHTAHVRAGAVPRVGHPQPQAGPRRWRAAMRCSRGRSKPTMASCSSAMTGTPIWRVRCTISCAAGGRPTRRALRRRPLLCEGIPSLERTTASGRGVHRDPALASVASTASIHAASRKGTRQRHFRVASMSASVCASETKPASNCDGARYTPRSSMAWKKRA